MIASHYAEPLARRLNCNATLLDGPDGVSIAELQAGDTLRMLDCSRGWAWGYAPDGRVGYVPSAAVGA